MMTVEDGDRAAQLVPLEELDGEVEARRRGKEHDDATSISVELTAWTWRPSQIAVSAPRPPMKPT